MKTITQELANNSKGLLTPVSEGGWDGRHYLRFNSAGVECEVGELLYAFTRIQKPLYILETGTHVGVSATYFAKGCQDNDMGIVHTVEFDPNHYQQAENLWGTLGLQDYIRLYKERVETFVTSHPYDLMLIDTEPQMRFSELERFYDHLNPGGYVFLHDLSRHMGQYQHINPDHPQDPFWPWGKLPKKISNWLKDRDLVPFYFNSPRGLTGLYKQHPGDYKI